MSSIIEKAFDASKKIALSIFRGTPNLITSSDLNRQMEALKYQLDSLDDRIGGSSDIEVTPLLSGSTLRISVEYSYMEFKGCSFSPSKTIGASINLTESAPTVYVLLTATKRTITYSDDSSHEIAGAKFQDGSSYPAADQIVYENEEITLSHNVSDVQNVVGVIAVISLINGKAVVNRNTMEKNGSLPISLRSSTNPIELYKVESMDYSTGDFTTPNYLKLSVGDIIKLCIPCATWDDGYASFEVSVPITTLTGSNYSGWVLFTDGYRDEDTGVVRTYCGQVLFNYGNRSFLFASTIKFTKIDGAYFEVIRGSKIS